MAKRLLESLPDRTRVCVLLRADGWSYEEIASFLNVGERMVRHELERATEAFPGLLDHRRPENKNRLFRLAYLAGVSDAGGSVEQSAEYLDGLVVQAEWLRSRMIARESMIRDMARRRDGDGNEGIAV